MARIIYLNGQYLPVSHAAISPEDRGFLFGDAVYEVVACIHGHLADETGHLDRLERSLNELKMRMPVERETLRFLMRETLRRNKQKNAAIYIQISRGTAKRDFKFPAADTPQTLMIISYNHDYDNHVLYEKGLKIKTLPDIRWPRRDIKTTLLLPQSYTKQLAVEEGYDDAWMVDDEGYITEGTSNNAWIITQDNEIITRGVSTDILNGVTRTAFKKLAEPLGYKITECSFTATEAYEAKEAFISSAGTFAVPVVNIDGHIIADGKRGEMSKVLHDEYRAYVEGLRGQQVSWEAGL